MATSINVRLSDEIEKKLKDTVNKVKKNTPTGAEVNNSTIVRGALEEFFKKIEDEDKGVKTIRIDTSILNDEEMEKCEEIIQLLRKKFSEISEEENNVTTLIRKTLLALKYAFIQD